MGHCKGSQGHPKHKRSVMPQGNQRSVAATMPMSSMSVFASSRSFENTLSNRSSFRNDETSATAQKNTEP